VLHPPPFFARLCGGREPRRASRLPRLSRMVRNRTAWASGGFHAAPEGTDRWSTPPPEGGRGTEAVSTPLYAAPSVAAELTPFCPSSSFFSFLVSSRVFLLFFFASGRGALLTGPKLRNPAPAREVAESSRSVRRRRGEESRRAPLGSVGDIVSDRALPVAWAPSPPPRMAR
jgi:hypothetical protein